MTNKNDAYAQAGVSLSAGAETTKRISAAVKSTHDDRVVSGLGSFGGVFAMTDLAAVVCEPGAVASLAGKPSIADTLVRRAGRRAERHRATRGRRQDRTQTLSSDLIDDRYTTNNHGELDDLVALRSALRQLRSEVTAAVDHGLASGTQWDNLCDAVIRPALGLPSTSPTRRNGSRARQALGPYIDHALDVA